MRNKTRSRNVGLNLLAGSITGISGLVGCILILLQLAFYLAIVGGVIYFIVFACTHWLHW